MEKKIIQNGIKNLKEFGYPHVNEENIFTDIVYSEMFKSMLLDNKGYGLELDEVIEKLLNRISLTTPKD